MSRIRNKSTVPSGMLNPSGLGVTFVNPNVQATVRPAGSLLQPSAGFDTIRRGKNRFQGKGPTGGFREMEFAEDVGATGAALSVIPGDTTSLEASEWLPEDADSMPEGAMIIADRGRAQEPGFARILHEGYSILPDMGDRGADRPRSRAYWMVHPGMALRADWQENPAAMVLAGIGAVFLGWAIIRDYESKSRGRGVAGKVAAAPAAAAQGTGDTSADAIEKVGEAADDAVKRIETATDKAVNSIESAAGGN